MVRIIKATVLTSTLDHKTHRVKLKSEGIWEESNPASVLGDISLNVGDVVYVDASNYFEPIVLGKVRDNNYETKASLDGHQVFESITKSGWSVLSANGNQVVLENSQGSILELSGSSMKIKSSQFDVEGNNITIKGGNVKITGGTLEIKGTATTDMNGPLCAIKMCPFTGAPHIGSKVSGT